MVQFTANKVSDLQTAFLLYMNSGRDIAGITL